MGITRGGAAALLAKAGPRRHGPAPDRPGAAWCDDRCADAACGRSRRAGPGWTPPNTPYCLPRSLRPGECRGVDAGLSHASLPVRATAATKATNATRRRPQRRGSRSARVARRRGHRRRWPNPLAVLPTIPLEVPPTEDARAVTMPGAATAAFRGCASGKTRPRPPEPRRRKRATRRATRRVGQRSTAAEDAGREGCVRSGSGHPLSSPGSRGPAGGRAR